MINFQVESDQDLTIMTCEGLMSFEEFQESVKKLYSDKPTMNMLWDLSNANLSEAMSDHPEKLAQYVKSVAHSRSGGKNAIVSPDSFSYSLGKIFQLFAEMAQLETTTQVFRSRADADSWLNGS